MLIDRLETDGWDIRDAAQAAGISVVGPKDTAATILSHMKRLRRLSRRDLVSVFVVAIALLGAVAFLVERQPKAGTARYIAAHIEDPDRCDAADFQPLWNPELAAWRRRAIRSSNFACGTAGPVVQWARFRTSADLEAALHASSGTPEYVCRTDVDLVRLIGFAREIDEATCAALHGRQVAF